jgi:hypothetical protein
VSNKWTNFPDAKGREKNHILNFSKYDTVRQITVAIMPYLSELQIICSLKKMK